VCSLAAAGGGGGGRRHPFILGPHHGRDQLIVLLCPNQVDTTVEVAVLFLSFFFLAFSRLVSSKSTAMIFSLEYNLHVVDLSAAYAQLPTVSDPHPSHYFRVADSFAEELFRAQEEPSADAR